MKCPYCEEEIEEGLKQCPFCKEKLIKNKFVFPIIACISLLVLLSGIVFYFINNPIKFEKEANAKFITDETAEGVFFKEEQDYGYYGYVLHLIDKNGKRINNIDYGACPGFKEYPYNTSSFNEDLACVCVKKRGEDKCGFISEKGKFVIDAQYDNASNFSNGVTTAKRGSTYGILYKNGRFMPFDYDYIGEFSNGYTYVRRNEQKALINKKGKITVPFTNDLRFEYYYENGDFIMECIDDDGDKCAYVRKKDGKRITDYKYIAMGNGGMGSREFSENLAVAIVKDKKGHYIINVIDRNGNEIFQTNFEDTAYDAYYKEGLLKVTKDDNSSFGFIDKKGKIVIPLEYDEACSFHKGYSIVKNGEEYGFINKKNKYTKLDNFPNDEYMCNYYIKNGKQIKK